MLGKDELTEEERGQQLELAKEIRTLESQLETFKPEAKPAAPAAIIVPGVDEQRAAFTNYLRGIPFDTRALTMTGVGATGGYLVPEAFLAEVIQKLNELTVMRGLARTITIDNASVKIPKLTSSVSAAWTAEAAAIEASEPAFDQVEFMPYKLAALTLVFNELLADNGVNIESFLAGLFAEKLAEVEDAAFFKGDGSGKLTGLLTDVDIDGVPAAAATAITADEVIDLYDTLPPQYRENAVWVMNPAMMNVLRKLKDPAPISTCLSAA